MRPVWAEIDLQAIDHNIDEVKKIIKPTTKIMAIVKANAYGHGAIPVAERALKRGVEYLGVALLQEAIELREHGLAAPILILGYTPEKDYELLVRHKVTQTIYSINQAKSLNEVAKNIGIKAKIHVKLDTGMGRLGFTIPESIRALKDITRLPYLELEGLFTHLAISDAKDKSYSQMQLAKFLGVCHELDKAGISIKYKHTANSGAIIDLPESHLDLVRPGIMLYGLYPSKEVDHTKVNLKQAMTLKTHIIHLKKVPVGTSISYGCTFTTQRPARIATLPVGYADGYSRLLSNKGFVLVSGERVPVIGRICMDQCMLDVTNVADVRLGDEVVLFGFQGQAILQIDEVADLIGTINYEVVSMVSDRVPRRYV